jgi:hypothetical protein
MENNDPKPAVEAIRKFTKVHPYEVGGGHEHAIARHRIAIRLDHGGLGQELFRWRQDLQVDFAEGHPGREVLVADALRQHVAPMLDTLQRYPRAGSQSYPSPAAEPNADGSTTVYFSPTQPEGVKRGNWVQIDPRKGWFVLLCFCSPLEPFFSKQWRPARSNWFGELA